MVHDDATWIGDRVTRYSSDDPGKYRYVHPGLDFVAVGRVEFRDSLLRILLQGKELQPAGADDAAIIRDRFGILLVSAAGVVRTRPPEFIGMGWKLLEYEYSRAASLVLDEFMVGNVSPVLRHLGYPPCDFVAHGKDYRAVRYAWDGDKVAPVGGICSMYVDNARPEYRYTPVSGCDSSLVPDVRKEDFLL